MDNRRRVEYWLAIVGFLCMAVAFVRTAFLSVGLGPLEYGLWLLGVVLVVAGVALFEFSPRRSAF